MAVEYNSPVALRSPQLAPKLAQIRHTATLIAYSRLPDMACVDTAVYFRSRRCTVPVRRTLAHLHCTVRVLAVRKGTEECHCTSQDRSNNHSQQPLAAFACPNLSNDDS